MIAEDGLYAANDFPATMPEMTAPTRRGFTWQPPPDALSREDYIRIGRPMLIAAGFLRTDGAEVVKDEPPLPRMGDTPRKRKAAAKVIQKPKEPEVPF